MAACGAPLIVLGSSSEAIPESLATPEPTGNNARPRLVIAHPCGPSRFARALVCRRSSLLEKVKALPRCAITIFCVDARKLRFANALSQLGRLAWRDSADMRKGKSGKHRYKAGSIARNRHSTDARRITQRRRAIEALGHVDWAPRLTSAGSTW